MADYERYGDYNDIDEEKIGQRRPVLRLLRIFFTVALFLFAGFLIFRLIVAEYYPRALKTFRMTPALEAYAEENDLDPERVKISVPYDDNTRASFIADNLAIERNAGAVQFTLRLSKYTMTRLAETTGTDPEKKPDESRFIVRLQDDFGNVYEVSDQIGRSYLWYRSVRYCFDGVNFEGVGWIRAEIYLSSDPNAAVPYATIPVLDFSAGNAS